MGDHIPDTAIQNRYLYQLTNLPNTGKPSVVNLSTHEELELLAVLRINPPVADQSAGEPATINDNGPGPFYANVIPLKRNTRRKIIYKVVQDKNQHEQSQSAGLEKLKLQSTQPTSHIIDSDVQIEELRSTQHDNGETIQTINEDSQDSVVLLEHSVLVPDNDSHQNAQKNESGLTKKIKSGNFISAKVVKLLPSPNYLLLNEQRPSCPACLAHMPRGQLLIKHLFGHIGDHKYEKVIIADGEEDFVKPTESRVFCTKTDSFFVSVRFHCPVSDCPHGVLRATKYFKKLKFLKQHYQKVHAEKKSQCPKCLACFATKSLRDGHQRVCGMKFKCGSCDKEYNYLTSLQTHARRLNHVYDVEAHKELMMRVKESIAKENVDASLKVQAHGAGNHHENIRKGKSSTIPPKQLRKGLTCSSSKAEPVLVNLASEDEDDAVNNADLDKLSTIPKENEPGGVSAVSEKKANPNSKQKKPSTIAQKGRQFWLHSVETVPIRPRPSPPQFKHSTINSESQTDDAATDIKKSESRTASNSLKRRKSACTQTHKTCKVSIDTQTTNKRRRKSPKNSTSAETQTNEPCEVELASLRTSMVNRGSNTNEANDSNSELQIFSKPSFEDETQKSGCSGETIVHDVSNTSQDGNLKSKEVHVSGTQDWEVAAAARSSVGLSTVLFNDMSTSPMRMTEEFDLFADLFGANTHTQTDFAFDDDDYSDQHQLQECLRTNRETQTSDASYEILENIALNFTGTSLDLVEELSTYLETIDGETQTL